MKWVVTKKLQNYFIPMKAKTTYVKKKINEFDSFHVLNIKVYEALRETLLITVESG